MNLIKTAAALLGVGEQEVWNLVHAGMLSISGGTDPTEKVFITLRKQANTTIEF